MPTIEHIKMSEGGGNSLQYMALVPNGNDLDLEPEVALSIDPTFEGDFKPKDPQDPRTLINILTHFKCLVNCLAVNERVIAVGTDSGLVIVCDPLGYVDHRNNIFHVHARKVLSLDIEMNGEFIASGGEDGRVIVLDMASAASSKKSEYVKLNHQLPVRAVALDPNFSAAKEKRVLAGCGPRVVLYTVKKASLFSSPDPLLQVLVDGVSSIVQLSWQKSTESTLVAWSTEAGVVTVYCERRKENVAIFRPNTAQVVARTSQSNSVTPHFKVSLGWGPSEQPDSAIIYISYGSLFQVYKVSGGLDPRNSTTTMRTPRMQDLMCQVELESQLSLNTVFASIRKNGKSFLATAIGEKELVLCEIASLQRRSVPIVSTFDFPSNGHTLVAMASLPSDSQTYVITENGQLFIVKLNFIDGSSGDTIYTDYVDYLLKTGDAENAAALLPKIFSGKVSKSRENISWDQWLTKFDDLNQLPAVADYLPTEVPAAGISYPSKDKYNMVLERVLKFSVTQFENLIWKISPELYNPNKIKIIVLEEKGSSNDPHLESALGALCLSTKDYESGIHRLLKLRHSQLPKIPLVHPQCFSLLENRIASFVECGENLAEPVNLLVAHLDKFPVTKVISQLKAAGHAGGRALPALFEYLKRMIDEAPDDLRQQDVDLLVTLYADLDPENLLTFLRANDAYRLERALDDCKKRHLYRACVYLYGKGGKMFEAIDLIIKELGSIDEAVDFCREKGAGSSDRSLWMLLAERVVTHRPNLVADLLRSTGTELLDPAEVIKLIPKESGRFVPGLREALECSLTGSERQLTLLASARLGIFLMWYFLFFYFFALFNTVVGNDIREAFGRISKSVFSASAVLNDRAVCQECREPLMTHTAAMKLNVFACRHVYHYDCLTNPEADNCPVCGQLQEKGGDSTVVSPQSKSFPVTGNNFQSGNENSPMTLPVIGTPLQQFSGLLNNFRSSNSRN